MRVAVGDAVCNLDKKLWMSCYSQAFTNNNVQCNISPQIRYASPRLFQILALTHATCDAKPTGHGVQAALVPDPTAKFALPATQSEQAPQLTGAQLGGDAMGLYAC